VGFAIDGFDGTLEAEEKTFGAGEGGGEVDVVGEVVYYMIAND
jgi:hypothetical protein